MWIFFFLEWYACLFGQLPQIYLMRFHLDPTLHYARRGGVRALSLPRQISICVKSRDWLRQTDAETPV